MLYVCTKFNLFIFDFAAACLTSKLVLAEEATGDSFTATILCCTLRPTATSAVGLILVARKTDPRRDRSPSFVAARLQERI